MVAALETFDSDRYFQVWHFTVSHTQLLLRSNRDDNHPTRVEVLFKGVQRLDIPSSFDGLHVRRDRGRYALGGRGWVGSVFALAMFAVEDEGEYSTPSSLFIEGL